MIATEKMDGGNVCLERSSCFARSHGRAPSHPSFDAFKALHARVNRLIPDDFQIFGEWLFAKHSILYERLPSYLMVIGCRDLQKGSWASWGEVEEWARELGFPTVPFLGRFGPTLSPLAIVDKLASASTSRCGKQREGFVLRWEESFPDECFSNAVGKWVRKDHIQSNDHWMHQKIVRNHLQG